MPSTGAGLGVFWTCQTSPFQRSASVTPGWGAGDGENCPTALHARAVGHETPPSRVPFMPSLPTGFGDRRSTRLNSSHLVISYAVFCLKKKKVYQVISA